MTDEPTNQELAAVARRAADIIVERGKATGTLKDPRGGRVCALGALVEAQEEMDWDASTLPLPLADLMLSALPEQPLGLVAWSDLPTTTAADIAKVFLQVADDLAVAP